MIHHWPHQSRQQNDKDVAYFPPYLIFIWTKPSKGGRVNVKAWNFRVRDNKLCSIYFGDDQIVVAEDEKKSKLQSKSTKEPGLL